MNDFETWCKNIYSCDLSDWFAASDIIEGVSESPPAPRRVYQMKQLASSNEKPFSCPDCGKDFRTNAEFKLHYMIHTGAKPHKCQFCDRSFRQRPLLKSHLYTWHKEELLHGTSLKFKF